MLRTPPLADGHYNWRRHRAVRGRGHAGRCASRYGLGGLTYNRQRQPIILFHHRRSNPFWTVGGFIASGRQKERQNSIETQSEYRDHARMARTRNHVILGQHLLPLSRGSALQGNGRQEEVTGHQTTARPSCSTLGNRLVFADGPLHINRPSPWPLRAPRRRATDTAAGRCSCSWRSPGGTTRRSPRRTAPSWGPSSRRGRRGSPGRCSWGRGSGGRGSLRGSWSS